MDDRLKAHARNFDKLDWESFPEGKQVHAYAETMVSETSTLHNVLKRYLSPIVVEVPIILHPIVNRKMIMDGVFASYISRLTDEYTKIESTSPKVKETMLEDAKHLTDKLSALPGVRKMDQGLIQAVEVRETTLSTLEPQKQGMENGTSNKKELVPPPPASKEEVLFDASQTEGETGS